MRHISPACISFCVSMSVRYANTIYAGNLVCARIDNIPYSSRYNIFVNFVIEFAITKILFTKYLYARIVLCRRAVANFIFTKFSFMTISRDSQNFCAAKIWSYMVDYVTGTGISSCDQCKPWWALCVSESIHDCCHFCILWFWWRHGLSHQYVLLTWAVSNPCYVVCIIYGACHCDIVVSGAEYSVFF